MGIGRSYIGQKTVSVDDYKLSSTPRVWVGTFVSGVLLGGAFGLAIGAFLAVAGVALLRLVAA